VFGWIMEPKSVEQTLVPMACQARHRQQSPIARVVTEESLQKMRVHNARNRAASSLRRTRPQCTWHGASIESRLRLSCTP